MIWKNIISPEQLNVMGKSTIGDLIGIEFVEIGENYLVARMPVDARTHQPAGILHGGASVVLAETLGSVAATLCIDNETQFAVGLDINANHLRSVKSGFVYGTTTPIHIGRTTQVWSIEIKDEAGKMVCISRITMAILDKK